MSFLLDIALIVSCVVIFMLGFSAGITRSIFAVAAGFLGIMAASRYPDQSGVNYYIILAAVVVIVLIAGSLTQKVVKFFYLNIVDKAAGGVLGVFVWALVALNVILPSIHYAPDFVEKSKISLSRVTLNASNRYLPQFGSFAIGSMRQEFSSRVSEIMSDKKISEKK